MKVGRIFDLRLSGKITRKTTFSWFLFYLVSNSFWATVIWATTQKYAFAQQFIYEHCVGLTSISIILAALFVTNPTRISVRLIIIWIFGNIGMDIGIFWGSKVSGIHHGVEEFTIQILLSNLVGFLYFGSVFYWQWASDAKASLYQGKIKRLMIERQVEKDNLRALQAQIEPHFLFNTLSSVLELLDTDPEKAKSMQVNLIQYLRSSLSSIRVDSTTIVQQMEMLRAYFDIISIRTGDRLRFRIDVPVHLNDRPFPPMLIQPLIENAIKNRLKSKTGWGEISIRAEEQADILRLVFIDTGSVYEEESENLTYVTEIKDRLQHLYGSVGRLIINEDQSGAMEVIIEVSRD
jgi:sensor histidine kinase YesM